MRSSGLSTDALDLSGSDQTAAISLKFRRGYSISLSWTGTAPTGDFKLQASNDAFRGESADLENSGATWIDITGSTQAAGGAAGTHVWNVSDAYYQAVRVVYDRTSGTGSCSVDFFGKGDN